MLRRLYTASWQENEHVGKLIIRDHLSSPGYYIISNTDTSITMLNGRSGGFTNGIGYIIRDLHLSSSSDCRDAGDPSRKYWGQKDMDDEVRVMNVLVDIGTDEYNTN